MLGLPKTSVVNKQLPKKAIYTKFQMNTSAKERIDKDISRITIVNEISSSRVNIQEGENVKTFYVLLVNLKKKDYDDKNIITISKIIPQNILMLLEYEGEYKLAVYYKKLMQTQWLSKDSLSINLIGLTLDKVWENIIVQIGSINIENGNTLDEQIAIDEQRNKLLKEIAKLEKMARNEKQPRKKFELVQKINKMKKEMSE